MTALIIAAKWVLAWFLVAMGVSLIIGPVLRTRRELDTMIFDEWLAKRNFKSKAPWERFP